MRMTVGTRILNNQIKSRRLFLWGEIDDNVAKRTIYCLKHLLQLSLDPIYLYIHSPGGCTDAEDAILNEIFLAQYKTEIHTIVQGVAFSAAADILALGTKDCRWSMPYSSIMMHPTSYSLESDYQAFQENAATFFKIKSEIVNKLVAEACGKGTPQKYKKFMKDIDKSLWMTAEQGIKYGVIDDIWTHEQEDEIDAQTEKREQQGI